MVVLPLAVDDDGEYPRAVDDGDDVDEENP